MSFGVTHRPAVSLFWNAFRVSVFSNYVLAEGLLTSPTDTAAAASATACQEEQQEQLEQQQSTKKRGEPKDAFAMARCVDRKNGTTIEYRLCHFRSLFRASNEIVRITMGH